MTNPTINQDTAAQASKDNEAILAFMREMTNELDVSPGIVEYIAGVRSLCLTRRIAYGQENIQHKHTVPTDEGTEFQQLRQMARDAGYHIVVEASDRIFGIKGFSHEHPYPSSFININDLKDSVTVFACGDEPECEAFVEQSKKYGTARKVRLTVLQAEGPKLSEKKHWLEGNEKRIPKDVFYPQISCGLKALYDDFMASDEPVLILIGKPGMAKTTLVRGLLYHTNKSACAVYDSDTVRSHLSAVVDAMNEEENQFAIFEDASDLIASREDGNKIMQTLLNTSDGLTPQTKGKKIIFTTNLPSIANIDEALMRPGRCYGVINFNAYTAEQARAVAEEQGIKDHHFDDSKSYTLAEVIEQGRNRMIAKQSVRRMGFGV